MRLNGARIVVECVIEQGVDTVFGYPGGTVLNIYDELYKAQDRLRHVMTAHEQGAAHAADGYARASGKVGVVIATSGPGATNLVTGIATAFMDSIPVVAITGNVATKLLGKDSFQEIDIAGVTMPITKHNFLVKDVESLAPTLRKAFDIARSGRPGPVLVDIPKDLTIAEAEWSPEPVKPRNPLSKGSVPANDIEIAEAVEMIASSARPFVIAGGGVIAAGASERLDEFVGRLDAPFALTLMGQGALPSTHPAATGMVGMHGSRASNMALREADLLVAIGARFSDRVIGDPTLFARGARILHIDIDPSEIGKNVQTYRSLIGDVNELLGTLNRLVPEARRQAWRASVDALKASDDPPRAEDAGFEPKAMFEAVHEAFGDDTIISTEVGQHQMWTAQFYPFSKPRTFLSSLGLGTMGYGTGASIGAQMAKPSSRVVHIAGDGSFRMNLTELGTIATYGLPITILVVNNGTLGMVRQWQSHFYGSRYSETTLDRPPDFMKLADAYGVKGRRPADLAELRRDLAEAAAGSEPTLIEVRIDIDEGVYPFVPPGKGLDQQILGAVD